MPLEAGTGVLEGKGGRGFRSRPSPGAQARIEGREERREQAREGARRKKKRLGGGDQRDQEEVGGPGADGGGLLSTQLR